MALSAAYHHNDPEAHLNASFWESVKDNEWAPVLEMLGTPNKTADLVNALNLRHPIEGQTLYDAYLGQNRLLSEEFLESRHDYNSWHFDACPLERTNTLGDRTTAQWIFPATPFDPIAPLAMVRHISYNEVEDTYNIGMYGLGFRFEKQWLENAPRARQIFQGHINQLKSDACLTAKLMVLRALQRCKSVWAVRSVDSPFQNIGEMMADFTNMFAIANKDPFALTTIGNYVRRTRSSTRGRRATMCVLAPGCRAQLAVSPYYRTFLLRGPDSARFADLGELAFTDMNGVRIIEEETYEVTGVGPTLYNAFVSNAVISGYFTSDNEYLSTFGGEHAHNTAEQRTVAAFDFDQDNAYGKRGIDRIIDADQSIDPNSGHLRYDVLSHLAKNYLSLFSEFDFEPHKSANGDDLVDPHLYFDGDVCLVAEYFGDVDPHYASDEFLAKAGSVNAGVLKLTYAKEMAAIAEGVQVLKDASMVSIPSGINDISVIDAFATAVVSDSRNVNLPFGRARGLTPGNSYGCDYVPPVHIDGGRRYIGTLAADGRVAPIYAVFNDTLSRALGKPTIFYSADGAGTNAGDWQQRLVPAPDFPPAFSRATHMASLANAFQSGERHLASWYNYTVREEPIVAGVEVVAAEPNNVCREKLQKLVAANTAYNTLFPVLKKIFGGIEVDKSTQNLLMLADSVAFWERPAPDFGTLDSQLSSVAFFDQAFLGMASPLAVGSVFPLAATGAVGYGLFAAAMRSGPGLERIAAMRTSVGADNGVEALSSQAYAISADKLNAIANVLIPSADAAGARASIALFVSNPQLSDDLRQELVNNAGRNLLQRLDAAIAAGPSDVLTPLPGGSGFERLQSAIIPQLGNQSAAGLLSSTDPVERARGMEFINRIWRTLSAMRGGPKLTSAIVDTAATRAGELDPDVITVAAERNYPGRKRGRQVEAARERYSERIHEDAEEPTGYVVTRMSVNRAVFSSVNPASLYNALIRPTAVDAATLRVIEPFADAPIGLALIPAGVPPGLGALTGDSFLRGATGRLTPSEVAARGSTIRAVGRASMTDGSVINTRLGPAGLYSRGGHFTDISTAAATGSSSGSPPLKRVAGASYAGVSNYESYAQGNRAYVDPADYDVASRIRSDAVAGGEFGDLSLSPQMLELTSHSKWMAYRFATLDSMGGLFERALTAALICSRIHRSVLKACVRNNLVLPRTYVLINAFIELRVNSAIWLSPNVGVTEFAFEDVSTGFDHNTLDMAVRASFAMGVGVTDKNSVTNFPAFRIERLLSGASGRFVRSGGAKRDITWQGANDDMSVSDFNYERPLDATRRGDCFVFATGVDYTGLPNPLPLSGRFDPVAFKERWTTAANQMLNRMAWPAAAFANLMCNFHHIGRAGRTIDRNEVSGWDALTGFSRELLSTPLCWRLPQMGYNNVTGQFDRVISAGSGPLGVLASGAGAVFRGQAGFIAPQARFAMDMNPGSGGIVVN